MVELLSNLKSPSFIVIICGFMYNFNYISFEAVKYYCSWEVGLSQSYWKLVVK